MTVYDAACEPVEPGDREAVCFAGLDKVERPSHAWPLQGSAGLVEVLDPFGDGVSVRSGELGYSFALDGGADELVAFSAADTADADVADEPHRDGSLYLCALMEVYEASLDRGARCYSIAGSGVLDRLPERDRRRRTVRVETSAPSEVRGRPRSESLWRNAHR